MSAIDRLRLFIKESWVELLPLILVPSAVSLVYAEPWVFGVISLFVAIPLLILFIRNRRAYQGRFPTPLLLPVALILLGAFFIHYSDAIRPYLLDNVYGATLNPQGKLNKKTESELKNSEKLWPLKLSQTNRIIDTSEEEGKELNNLLSFSDSRLFFLTGPAGTGKSPLLRQWTFHVLKNQQFGNAFFISLRSEEDFLKSNPSLPELVANVYRDVIKSPDYYELLFKSKPCLIVLDDLDEIDGEVADRIMKHAYNLVHDTLSKVVIGSRPERVLLSDWYRRELQFAPDLIILGIEPLEGKHQEYFIKDAVRKLKLSADVSNKVRELIEKRPAIKEMATQLDHLNEIIRHVDEFSKKSDLEIMESLVELRKKRNQDSHWARLGINADQRMEEIYKIAYRMSRENKSQATDNELNLSGFVTVVGDQYEFSPGILQAYFAIKGLERDASNQNGQNLSKTLLENLSEFNSSLPSPLIALVKNSFQRDPLQYRESIDLIKKIVNDESFVSQTLAKLDHKKLIDEVILKAGS